MTMIFVMMSVPSTFASIPDGQWCRLEGDPGAFYGSVDLNISFANPEKKDGRIYMALIARRMREQMRCLIMILENPKSTVIRQLAKLTATRTNGTTRSKGG